MTYGVDVSHFQGAIDWGKAHAAGVDFAFAKATEGTGFRDPRFASNLAGMRAAGVLPGAYHFARPGDGAAQADAFLSAVGNPAGVLLAVDVEVSVPYAVVAAFVARVKAKHPGHPVLVYTGRDLWRRTGDSSSGGSLGPLWQAGIAPNRYASGADGLHRSWLAARAGLSTPPFAGWAHALVVQWSDTCVVPGIPGRCDADWSELTVEQLRAYASAGTPATPPRPRPPAPTPAFTLGRILVNRHDPKLLMRGGDVAAVQRQLVKLGYRLPKWGADGVYGDEVERAVRALQAHAHLAVDGRVGHDTTVAAGGRWTGPA